MPNILTSQTIYHSSHKNTLQATGSVISRPTNSDRDVTDYAAHEALEIKVNQTPKMSPPVRQTPELSTRETPERVEAFHDVDFEFSDGDIDVEMEQEFEPPRTRSRSQSRNKENSIPPAEPQPKRYKVKRVIKTKTVVKNESKPRRRRIIEEELGVINSESE